MARTRSVAALLLPLALVTGCTASPPDPTGSSSASPAPVASTPPATEAAESDPPTIATPTPPTPAPTASPTTAATTPPAPPTGAPADTTGWTPYFSEHYGFAIALPPGWSVDPPDGSWTMEVDAGDWDSTAQEVFWSPERDVAVTAWTTRYAGEETLSGVHRWFVGFCRASPDACFEPGAAPVVPLCNGRGGGCSPGLLMPREPLAMFTGGLHERSITVLAVMRAPDVQVRGVGTSLELLEGLLSTMDVRRRT